MHTAITNPFYAGPRPASCTSPARGAAPARLRQAAGGAGQRQSGPALDQPVPFGRGR